MRGEMLASIGAYPRSCAVRMAVLLVLALMAGLAVGSPPATAQEPQTKRILLYTGTTGFRHADAIDNGRPVVQAAIEAAGYTVDWEDCDNNGGGAGNCDNPNKNPRVFTDDNLARYDAILLFNASSAWAGGGRPGPLWNADQRAAIIRFVQGGGGIAANHNATDMAAGVVSWDWWDGGPNSAVGSLMKGHGATSQGNVAQVEVADHHHLSTKDLPDRYGFGDEHYNFARSVRGTHHVLATLDERTYNPGNPMGQDHPITWCKLYDGDNVNDGTGTPKPYDDGRVWTTGMGHFGASYTANGGDNEIVKQIVGGVRWVAGEGKRSDCSGTVWSSFKRTTLVNNVNGPIGLDIAADGKVYWSEIGPTPGFESEGYIKMHDPEGEGNNKTTVATIPTRADHGNSEDGVLGMTLENGFDLSDPAKRDLYVYYSPRNPDWPTTGSQIAVGYNQISRFTLNAQGTAVVPGSERVILRVPKAKISGNPSGFPGGPTDSGPGHVGGAGLDFDSDGNLYLGVGDDVSPNASGHGAYPPMDYRAKERWDARKTSANSADLRGKVLRIHPLDDIPADAEPGTGTTYSIPAGNMFAPGTAQTRPEIYAMGFRQPFTVQTDPARPGHVVVGEYCHDNSANGAQRAPAGVCEWNLLDKPGFMGWPFCVGNNSPENTTFRWDYAANATTGQQYDCSLSSLPADQEYAPAGQTGVAPTFDGLDSLPGPAEPATIWKKYAGATGGQSPADFGDLSTGGMSPITGPVYRYDADAAGPGAFPPYYDGSWFIANRGSNDGFWKEVRLRKDNGKMLRVNDWAPTGQFGTPDNSFVIPSRFGPDGALYMARWTEGCCRTALNAGTQTQLVKIEFAVQDECLEDTQAPTVEHSVAGREHPDEAGTYLDKATLTISAGDAGCAGVDTVEYRVNSDAEADWQPYTEPVDFDEPGTYSVDYRATDEFGNVSEVGAADFVVVHVDDSDAPTVTGAVAGPRNDQGYYVSPATVTIDAEDDFSAISSIEYRVNQEEAWTKVDFDGEGFSEQTSKQFADSGFHFVEFRATDESGNTSEPQNLSFSVIGDCTFLRSDEFNGTALDNRWLRHTRNGGTPASGVMAPTVSNGQLTLPTNDFEIDAASATTALGPINFVGQDLPALGAEWSVETQFTVTHTGGWQGVGLMLWQADNNFFRSTITHSLSDGSIYVEQSKDNPTTAEGSRAQAGGNVTILPSKGPVTIRMRYARAAGANTVTAQYRVIAPQSAANPDWVNFPGAGNFLDLNPASGVRRDSAGSRVGIYAGGNFPGTSGDFPYSGTPANVVVDYVRVTPDEVQACADDDVEPPATTASLDPAVPGPGGTYDAPVDVILSGTDGEDANASGLDRIEYRVDGGAWQERENTASADPFATTVTVSENGAHTVRFRSRDDAGNLEPAGSVGFTVDKSTAEVRDVFAKGTVWDPDQLDVDFGDTVTWHFDEPEAVFPHDVWLVPPGGNPSPTGGSIFQVTDGPVLPDGAPAPYTFRKAGAWTFICRIHSSYSEGSGSWSGMVGAVQVGEDPDPDVAAPATTATLDPAAPGAGGTYDRPVRVTLSATDGGAANASGVGGTEYNVDGGAWQQSENTAGDDPFATSFEVSENGAHTVQFRSRDEAGNLESTGEIAFTIAKPAGGGDDPGGSGQPPTPTPTPTPTPPLTPTPTRTPQATAAKLAKLPKTRLASFLKKGLRVSSACETGLRGRVTVRLSRSQARKLGLKKATTLAGRAVRCGAKDRVTVTLKASAKLKRKLAKARGSVRTTVTITMGSGSAATSSSRQLVLSAPKQRD
jgi:plastocyanin